MVAADRTVVLTIYWRGICVKAQQAKAMIEATVIKDRKKAAA
jgi:hypothetical protein